MSPFEYDRSSKYNIHIKILAIENLNYFASILEISYISNKIKKLSHMKNHRFDNNLVTNKSKVINIIIKNTLIES